MKKISVVIPAYNEERNLKKGVLDEVGNYLENKGFNFEAIIVDDGSSDRTVEFIKKYVAKNKNFRLIQNSHGGKAKAVMTGMQDANGEIILFTDMDQATPINQIEKVIPQFERGFDIVIGSRQGRKGAPFVRKLAAWGFSVLRGIILGLPFKDTQTGFKAFSKTSVDKIIPKIRNEWGVVHFRGGAVNGGFVVGVFFLSLKYLF